MKNKKFTVAAIAIVLAMAGLIAARPGRAAEEVIKLPYEKGQSFVVVQGYDSPPTHIKKDYYAMDLSQDGCDAYGKLAVAASSGKVFLAQETGYNGGYGTQILVDDGGNILSRYAHLIPGTIPIVNGDSVTQGEPLGEIGNTGLVAGAACPLHPGTHIHFAMYGENADGSFSAFKPEPISGYENMTAGKWYLSDNALAIGTVSGLTAEISNVAQSIVGNAPSPESSESQQNDVAPSAPLTIKNSSTPLSLISSPVQISENATSPAASFSITTSSLAYIQPTSTIMPTTSLLVQSSSVALLSTGGGGGVSTIPSAPQISPPSQSFGGQATSSDGQASQAAISMATATFNSSTLAIDLSWPAAQFTSTSSASSSTSASNTITYGIFSGTATSTASSTPLATTTATSFSYQASSTDFGASEQFTIVANDDAGDLSTIESIPVTLPDWFTTIQPIDNENSNSSWYSDNWYDLGTGFYGDILALTLEGNIDNSSYRASHLYLDEYLDPNYTELNQTFTISNNAPFTDGLQKVTIGNLDIRLQPNKYYRLRTYQDYQNRSVILAGTSATGTAMWNEYIYGVGRVENQYSFYPYLSAVMIPNYPPLAPPNPPANMTTTFDSLNSIVNFSWSAATDPDTISSLLTYQWNISTSTSFDPAQWQSVGRNFSASAAVVFGNSYNIAVRAIDDLGNIGQPLVQLWNFPAGYVLLPTQLDHSAILPGDGAQSITFVATTTVSGIALWTHPSLGQYCCSNSFVSLHEDAGGSMGDEIASSGLIQLYYLAPGAERTYTFNDPQVLAAGKYWFLLEDGPTMWNGMDVYGSVSDSYAGGEWSTSPGQDAYFRISE